MAVSRDWYESIVLEGNKLGRTIGFPTLNLDPNVLPADTMEGVYRARVVHDGHSYVGALYIGPRLVINETKRVLEIYVLDFNQDIYGEVVRFCLERFIRGIMDFSSLEDLKRQLAQDIEDIKAIRQQSS